MTRYIVSAVLGLFFLSGASAQALTVQSPDLREGQTISSRHVFNGFGCTGENKAPALSWSQGPQGTQSYAITMYDPDAPTGSGWWHWTVLNIPASIQTLDPQQLPAGAVQTRSDYGVSAYGGPCPPAGNPAHRYIITVTALKDFIPLTKDASGAMAGFYIQSLKLDEGKITAFYGR